MTDERVSFDHVVAYAKEGLDAVAQHWRRLGFSLTERGYHSLGTMNNLVVMPGPYLEILGPNPDHDPPAVPDSWRRDGISGLAFTTSNADATVHRMREAGIEMTDPRAFTRPVEIDGEQQIARFRVTRVEPEQTPGVVLFFCEHGTPELVWRQEWMDHPNHVCGIHTIRIALPGYAAAGRIVARILGEPAPQTDQADTCHFTRDGVELVLTDQREGGITGEIAFSLAKDAGHMADSAPAYPLKDWSAAPLMFRFSGAGD